MMLSSKDQAFPPYGVAPVRFQSKGIAPLQIVRVLVLEGKDRGK